MDENIQTICNKVIEKYQPDKIVLGIMLFGSAARGKFDQYSDIDLFILLKQKGAVTRSNYIENGKRVDIIFNTVKEATSYLNQDKNSVRRITSHMLAYGQIIYQRGYDLEKIQAAAKENLQLKTKYTADEILMHKYSIDDFWGEVQRDLQNQDYVAYGLDSHLLVDNIIELFLKLHGEYWRQPNEMMQLLNKLDTSLADSLDKFYKTENIQHKNQILAALVTYTYQKTDGSLPDIWELK